MKKQKKLSIFFIFVLLVILYPIFFLKDISNLLSYSCHNVEEPLMKRYCYSRLHERDLKGCSLLEYREDKDKCLHDAYQTLKRSGQIDFWPSILRWLLPPIFLILLVIRYNRYLVTRKIKRLKEKIHQTEEKIKRLEREEVHRKVLSGRKSSSSE